MKYLKIDWQKRLSIVLLVSFVVTGALYGLEFTDWAAGINAEGYSHGEEANAESSEDGERTRPPWYLILLIVSLKMTLLISVPGLLFVGLWKLVAWLSKQAKLKFA